MRAIIITLIILLLLVIFFAIIPIFIKRPSSVSTATKASTLYESTDRGVSWQGIDEFPGGEVTKIIFDKNDANVVIVGTQLAGLWRGNLRDHKWEQYRDELGGAAKILDIIEPAASNDLIALTFSEKRGHVMRFLNGDVRELLFAPLDNFAFFKGRFGAGGAIEIIGSDGGLYRSSDGGAHWETLSRFRDGLTLFEINPANDSEIWAINSKGALFHSRSDGAVWEDLSNGLGAFSKAYDTKTIYFDPGSGALYHGSSFGLLVSYDHGASWNQVPLIAPPESLPVTSIAVDPKSSSKLFVGAQNQLYISNDSGQSWVGKQIPGIGVISSIAINPKDSKIILIGLEAASRI